ncbi:MAG: hypothetical protein V4549_07680 [Bacteroidota bacterium]
MEQKPLIIVAVKGKMHQQVFGPALPKVIAGKRKQLKDSGNWSGWLLQIRNPEAYKKVPILTKKLKTLSYEEKRAA